MDQLHTGFAMLANLIWSEGPGGSERDQPGGPADVHSQTKHNLWS